MFCRDSSFVACSTKSNELHDLHAHTQIHAGKSCPAAEAYEDRKTINPTTPGHTASGVQTRRRPAWRPPSAPCRRSRASCPASPRWRPAQPPRTCRHAPAPPPARRPPRPGTGSAPPRPSASPAASYGLMIDGDCQHLCHVHVAIATRPPRKCWLGLKSHQPNLCCPSDHGTDSAADTFSAL